MEDIRFLAVRKYSNSGKSSTTSIEIYPTKYNWTILNWIREEIENDAPYPPERLPNPKGIESVIFIPKKNEFYISKILEAIEIDKLSTIEHNKKRIIEAKKEEEAIKNFPEYEDIMCFLWEDSVYDYKEIAYVTLCVLNNIEPKNLAGSKYHFDVTEIIEDGSKLTMLVGDNKMTIELPNIPRRSYGSDIEAIDFTGIITTNKPK